MQNGKAERAGLSDTDVRKSPERADSQIIQGKAEDTREVVAEVRCGRRQTRLKWLWGRAFLKLQGKEFQRIKGINQNNKIEALLKIYSKSNLHGK